MLLAISLLLFLCVTYNSFFVSLPLNLFPQQVLQAAMLQQLAHARAEARQSQVQLEEANARAAAASSGGPMARAKSAEQAAKQTLEAAAQVGGHYRFESGGDIVLNVWRAVLEFTFKCLTALLIALCSILSS